MFSLILTLLMFTSFQKTLESPRLGILATAVKSGDTKALDQFWQEIKGHTPLVESVQGNDEIRRVTFLWRGGDDSRGIILLGPFPSDIHEKPLVRLSKTDVWFLTIQLPKTARFSYAFSLAGKPFADPLNPYPVTMLNTSLAELPDAPAQVWIQPRAGVSRGTLKQQRFASYILGEERSISIYTPADYAPGDKPYGLLVVFDGRDYRTIIPLPTILDNLISSRKIPPLIAILVDSMNQTMRNRDYSCSDLFSDFVARELVQWARQNYRVSGDAAKTVVCGVSLGGLAAAYTAFRYPEVFGKVLSQSGAFWYYPNWRNSKPDLSKMGWLARQFEASRRLSVRFYLECGLLENDRDRSILRENQRLRDVLISKGYNVTYSEFAGGHDYFCWRGSVADGLIALAGN